MLNAVPAATAGIVFLSGGQGDVEATRHLDLMNRLGDLPWPLSFSYGRALQQETLKTWAADPESNRKKAQEVLAHRAKKIGRASCRDRGERAGGAVECGYNRHAGGAER